MTTTERTQSLTRRLNECRRTLDNRSRELGRLRENGGSEQEQELLQGSLQRLDRERRELNRLLGR